MDYETYFCKDCNNFETKERKHKKLFLLATFSYLCNIMEIFQSEFVISSEKLSKCPTDDKIEYAFIGRSNVGKSSLINMLTNNKKLAKTSSTPGKTLLINHFLINKEWYIVDLPGYGYAKRSMATKKKIEQMITSYILQREQLVNLFVLIDIRHEPQTIDMEFINWLGTSNIPFTIIFTKADKISASKIKINVDNYVRKLEETWEVIPPYFVTSSANKTGKQEVLDYIDEINKSLKTT